MARVVILSDRPVADALPTAETIGMDVKVLPLGAESLDDLPDLSPSAVVVDALTDPDTAFGLLSAIGHARVPASTVVLASPAQLERHPWASVADALLLPETPSAEIRVRLGMLLRRAGGESEATLRLGPLSLDIATYSVTVHGVPLALTYKEFELLRFLLEHPGRVFTRSDLLQQVWGYNFYGGSRTVDVHVRRLRAKLGPEHESVIETVRGVGYRAREPNE